jgi:hypothetical protein
MNRMIDLPLGVEDPAAGSDEHEQKGAEQLGKESSPLQARVVELGLGPKFERKQMAGACADRVNAVLRLPYQALLKHGRNLTAKCQRGQVPNHARSTRGASP